MKTEKEYCLCGVLVAPNDPEQKVFRGKVWHGKCFQKEAKLKPNVGQQLTLVIEHESILVN